MKKTFISLISILVITASVLAQDVIQLNHRYFTSWFSKSSHIPILVTYTLKKDMFTCSESGTRTNNYSKDPLLPEFTDLKDDYLHSGYSRGHNMSAEDNQCSKRGMKECFYYSNMTPQPQSFNAGKWKALENRERATARIFEEVIVTIGSIGEFETIGEEDVVVPEFMWKVIYTPSTDVYLCYIFPNKNGLTNPLDSFQVNLSDIKTRGNVDFSDGVVDPGDIDD